MDNAEKKRAKEKAKTKFNEIMTAHKKYEEAKGKCEVRERKHSSLHVKLYS